MEASLSGGAATLTWSGPEGAAQATMVLPGALEWHLERGETDPISGWYSPAFGVREPATVVVGAGVMGPDPLQTEFRLEYTPTRVGAT